MRLEQQNFPAFQVDPKYFNLSDNQFQCIHRVEKINKKYENTLDSLYCDRLPTYLEDNKICSHIEV
jgi:hypothetical protein